MLAFWMPFFLITVLFITVDPFKIMLCTGSLLTQTLLFQAPRHKKSTVQRFPNFPSMCKQSREHDRAFDINQTMFVRVLNVKDAFGSVEGGYFRVCVAGWVVNYCAKIGETFPRVFQRKYSVSYC